MSKEIKISKSGGSSSGLESAVDGLLRLSSLGTVGLPSSRDRYDVTVDGKSVGSYSSKSEALKAASKK